MGVREWLIRALGGDLAKNNLAENRKSENSTNNQDSESSENTRMQNIIWKEQSLKKSESIPKSENSGYDTIEIGKNNDRSNIFSISAEKQNNRDVLLDIYEKLAKIEEITRVIDDRLLLLDSKVATREDSKEIINVLSSNSKKSNDIELKLKELDEKLTILEDIRENLKGKLTETTRQLTYLDRKETEIKKELELLEAHKRILDQIKNTPMSTIELANILGYTRQYVWERLQELKKAGYVTSKKEGRRTVYYPVNM